MLWNTWNHHGQSPMVYKGILSNDMKSPSRYVKIHSGTWQHALTFSINETLPQHTTWLLTWTFYVFRKFYNDIKYNDGRSMQTGEHQIPSHFGLAFAILFDASLPKYVYFSPTLYFKHPSVSAISILLYVVTCPFAIAGHLVICNRSCKLRK